MSANHGALDAIVVGGGPAGSTCARALEQSGLATAIVDRASFPRDKVCAGWITPAVFEELGVAPSEYRAAGLTLQPIRGFRAGILGRKMHEIDYDEPVSYGIRRCELDHFLLERAPSRKLLGRSVRSIERQENGWRLRLSEEDAVLRAPLLIGAGGHGCPVARTLGRAAGSDQRLVVAQEVEVRLSDAQKQRCAVRGDVPELYFTPDLLGYGWCFRKGDWLNIGLGRLDRTQIRRHVEDFTRWLRDSGRIGFDLGAQPKGHAYLIQGRERCSAVTDGALLVGDAAGLAYATSGEGIRPAVESAILAARVLSAADGDYSRRSLAPYERELAARFGTRPGRLQELLPSGLRAAIGRLLFDRPWFVRSVVLDRWFLRRRQGPIAQPPRPQSQARLNSADPVT